MERHVKNEFLKIPIKTSLIWARKISSNSYRISLDSILKNFLDYHFVHSKTYSTLIFQYDLFNNVPHPNYLLYNPSDQSAFL